MTWVCLTEVTEIVLLKEAGFIRLIIHSENGLYREMSFDWLIVRSVESKEVMTVVKTSREQLCMVINFFTGPKIQFG